MFFEIRKAKSGKHFIYQNESRMGKAMTLREIITLFVEINHFLSEPPKFDELIGFILNIEEEGEGGELS